MEKSAAILAMVFAVAAASHLPAQEQTIAVDVEPATQQPVREKKDPRLVVEDVKLALRGAKDVPSGAVTAVVHAETIVLTGEVSTELEAARALAVAEQNAQGVKVTSHVTVADTAPAATLVPELVRSVEAALRRDPRTANLGVVVSIDAQNVIGLHGLVPSRESRTAAEQVAERVEGVQRVSSRLVVAGE